MPTKYLIALVGMQHRGEDIQALVASLPNEEPLILTREKDNRFDARAVKVWARGEHVGYLKGSQNKEVSAWMDTLSRARQSEQSLQATLSVKEGGKWPMVSVEI